MPEHDFNTVFSKRLRYYLSKFDMTQAELAKRLNVGTTSVYNWCNGLKNPRMDKVDAMCDLFHCNRSDLIEDKNTTDAPEQPYYLNDETRAIAQEVFEKPELRSLFHVAKDIPPEELRAHIDFMKKLKDREKGNSEESNQN